MSFDVLDPWDETAPRAQGTASAQEVFAVIVMVIVLLGGGFLAFRNLRAGRSDVPGATRIAAFVLLSILGAWLVGGRHSLPPRSGSRW